MTLTGSKPVPTSRAILAHRFEVAASEYPDMNTTVTIKPSTAECPVAARIHYLLLQGWTEIKIFDRWFRLDEIGTALLVEARTQGAPVKSDPDGVLTRWAERGAGVDVG